MVLGNQLLYPVDVTPRNLAELVVDDLENVGKAIQLRPQLAPAAAGLDTKPSSILPRRRKPQSWMG
jgi:hypothetical protein